MNLTSRRTLTALAAGIGLTGGLALANQALVLDDLPPTLPGGMHDWTWRGYRVRYTTLGDGPPLALLHGIHAAASSFEMRNVFEPLSQRYTVYALDWLGFGKSERPDITYTAALYADLLGDFLAEVVGQPAAVLTSSLSAAYAIAAARARPGLVNWLILISPTGITSTGLVTRTLGRMLALPLVGTGAFNLLVSHASIQSFLRKAYADQTLVDDPLVGQHWATAHQPNARLAPAAFVVGALDLPLADSTTPVAVPILVIRGSVPGIGIQASDAEIGNLSPNVTTQIVDNAGQLPHDEAPDRTLALVEAWLGERR